MHLLAERIVFFFWVMIWVFCMSESRPIWWHQCRFLTRQLFFCLHICSLINSDPFWKSTVDLVSSISCTAEIILLRVNDTSETSQLPKESDGPGPTQLDIEKATVGLAKANVNRGTSTPVSVIDVSVSNSWFPNQTNGGIILQRFLWVTLVIPFMFFQMQIQLRRIFLTLLDTACHLQTDNPAVMNLLQQTLDRVRRKCRDFPEVDKDKLQQLVAMGFAPARAVRALRMFR